MVAFAVKGFGGEIPRKDSRELPDNMAAEAWNVDLASGPLSGMRIPQAAVDLSAFDVVQRAHRLPNPTEGGDDAWLPLPSPYSSVVRSPLANDTQHRVYWTNPDDVDDEGAYWNTFARVAAGNTGGTAPYNLGVIFPDPEVGPTVEAVGGTVDVPQVERSYCWTYTNIYDEESAPSLPSEVVAGYPDATWTVSGLPETAPSNPGGKNFPAVKGMWIYRTVTGLSTGAQFYRVRFYNFSVAGPVGGEFEDTTLDTTVVGNPPLISASWANPPSDLDGLTSLPGGMLVGFTENTIHFCEPNRPHAWPAGYDQSVPFKIVALAVWQQSLMVLTQGYPSSGTGSTPANFTLSSIQVPEPCIARGSVVTDLLGVFYASQNGLISLNYFGMDNKTLATFTKKAWVTDFHAASIIAARHRAQYLAINGTGGGFAIDYTEERLGVMQINTFSEATCIWNDVYTGDTYICADKKVYLWDSPGAGALVYRWRSKEFFLQQPGNMGACHIELTDEVLDPAPVDEVIPLDNDDPLLVLPEGINAMFRYYVDGTLIKERTLEQPKITFRLPAGRKYQLVQFEIVARVPVHSVEIATTVRELNGV